MLTKRGCCHAKLDGCVSGPKGKVDTLLDACVDGFWCPRIIHLIGAEDATLHWVPT